MTTIASIGTGNMGRALLSGILGSAAEVEARATTNSASSARELAQSLPTVQLGSLESDPRANHSATAGAHFVFLGVKPWMLAETLRDIAGSLAPGAVLVSMAAGVSTADIQTLAPGHPVVRIMPNTPSAIGHGVIALAPATDVAEADVELLTTLLSGAGLVVPMAEAEIPAMTGISGSGVAYFFLLAETLIAAGEKLGLSTEVARNIVVATANGAGRLLAENPDPATLRQSVSSKGGTTLAALQSFVDAGIFPIAEAAARAAAERSLEMEAENSAVINGE